MTDDYWQQLSDASREELLSCIRLLAVSVAQNRDSSSFVGLGTAAQSALVATRDNADPDLLTSATGIAEEALERVRALAAQSSTVDSGEDLDGDGGIDNRTQYRINIAMPVKLLWSDERGSVEAQLENISWGGASVRASGFRAGEGEMVRILLARPQGGSIAVESRVLRTWELPGAEGMGLALRFASLNTRDELKLEGILEHLARSCDESGRRGHARLTERLDLQFDGIDELRSTLHDVSTGGLGITVKEPLQIGQSLQAVISTLDTHFTLKLRARVVRQEPLNKGVKKFYRVGLKFEHPGEELQRRTSQFISDIVSARNR